jgi:hypothetical protein
VKHTYTLVLAIDVVARGQDGTHRNDGYTRNCWYSLVDWLHSVLVVLAIDVIARLESDTHQSDGCTHMSWYSP